MNHSEQVCQIDMSTLIDQYRYLHKQLSDLGPL